LYNKYWTYFTLDGWHFSFDAYKKIFKYAIFVMLSANVSALLSQIDKQMIVVILGTTQAGIYDIYLSLIRIPFMFLLPGVYFLFPVFSDLLKKQDTQKVQMIYTFMYELFSVLAIFMTSFFIFFGDELVSVLFPEYPSSGKILLYSSPFLIFNFLLQIDFQLLNAL
jgi:O-antigen/teichoic acid export membrane protein